MKVDQRNRGWKRAQGRCDTIGEVSRNSSWGGVPPWRLPDAAATTLEFEVNLSSILKHRLLARFCHVWQMSCRSAPHIYLVLQP